MYYLYYLRPPGSARERPERRGPVPADPSAVFTPSVITEGCAFFLPFRVETADSDGDSAGALLLTGSEVGAALPCGVVSSSWTASILLLVMAVDSVEILN